MPNPWDLPAGGTLTGVERFVADKNDAGTADSTVYYTPEDILDYVEDNISSVGGPDLSDATPAALGSASPGLSEDASRSDHVHALPTLAALGAMPLLGATRSVSASTTLTTDDAGGSVTVDDTGGTNKTFTLPVATNVGTSVLLGFLPVSGSPSAATLTVQLETAANQLLSIVGTSVLTVGQSVMLRKAGEVVVGADTIHVWIAVGGPTSAQVAAAAGSAAAAAATADVAVTVANMAATAAASAQDAAAAAIPTMDPAPAAGTFLKADGAGGLEAALFTETDLGDSLGALHAAIPTLAPLLTEQVEISASRSLTDADAGKILVCDTSGGAVTLTAPHDLPASWNALVIREGANNVVIDGSGGQTLVGPAASSGTVTIAVDDGGVTLVRRSATRVWAAGVIS